jgi:hypothetical protein
MKTSNMSTIVFSGLIAGLAAGCGTKDHIVAPTPPDPYQGHPLYPMLFDPYNVMDALRIAYEARDSVEIKKLYDDNYTGTSIDLTAPGGPLQLDFTKADEVRHVAAMAKSTSITNITLQWPPALTREQDLGDPPGWTTIRLLPNTVRLEVSDQATIRSIQSDQEQFEFKFIPTTPAPGSPTDTLWSIIRWSEVRSP